MFILVTSSLLILATVGPSVKPLDENRFRVQIVFDDMSPRGNAKALIAMMKAAKKFCKGQGIAVSEGAIELNTAEPLRKRKKALELIEVYRCKVKN